eukprot:PLAT12492.5.p1 GENE.PLAT12492.5~~PLAT12492.5.p1  ORF type:complete len:435 (-),score=153.04 PLAT12492.5:746-1876(-)
MTYRLADGVWAEAEVTGDVPAARHGHAAVALPGGAMLLHGGMNAVEEALYDDVYVLDCSSLVWTRLDVEEDRDGGGRPAARNSHALVALPGGSVLLFGGSSPMSGPMKDVWLLQLADGAARWQKLSPSGAAPTAREMHSAVFVAARPAARFMPRLAVLESEVAGGGEAAAAAGGTDAALSGTVYIYGGRGMYGVLGDVIALDLADMKWSEAVDTASARCAHTASLLPSGKQLVVWGGWDGAGMLFNAASTLLLDTATWTHHGYARPPPAARFAHAAAQSSEGDAGGAALYVFGGVDFRQDYATLNKLDLPVEELEAEEEGKKEEDAEAAGKPEGAAVVPAEEAGSVECVDEAGSDKSSKADEVGDGGDAVVAPAPV